MMRMSCELHYVRSVAAAAAVGVGSDTLGEGSSFMLNQMGRRGGGKVSRKRRDSATKQEGHSAERGGGEIHQ